jgi:hypothetical protein
VSTSGGDERRAAIAAAIGRGQTVQARRLVQAALRDSPRDTQLWTWACEVSTTLEDRIYCLRQILAIDPEHAEARRYLAQLQAALPPAAPPSPVGIQGRTRAENLEVGSSVPPSRQRQRGAMSPQPSPFKGEGWVWGSRRGISRRSERDPAPESGPAARRSVSDLLLTPLGCLLQISTTHILAALLVVALVGGITYYTANTDFFGLAGPDFDSLIISNSYQQLQAADMTWKITYERPVDSQFSGLVRGVYPIREGAFRILTHDILVTSGQYADPAIVSTSVLNHHFTWRSTAIAHPSGTINLLHTVPASQDIYRQLLEIKSDDEVTIGGREILTIQAYGRDGTYLGEWHDTGCNSLLVKSVSIVRK